METYIGNIICTKDCIKSKIFNVVDSLEKADKRFPSLIIGWENVKGIYPGVSILNWEITPGLFWTHHKNIKKSRYDSDIDNFKEYCLNALGKGIKYKPVNLFTSEELVPDFYTHQLEKEKTKYCYVTDKEIYIYCPGSSYVSGFSVYEIEYLGLSKYTFTEAIKRSQCAHFIYHDYDLPYEIKDRITNKKYMVPYLICLFEGFYGNASGFYE